MNLRSCLLFQCISIFLLTGLFQKTHAIVDPLADSVTGWFAFPYRLFIPDSASEINPLPLIVFLHGSGEQGTDNESQVLSHIQPLLELSKGNDYPCYLIAPQAPAGWGGDNSGPLILELIKHISNLYFVDRRRVYVTGLSNGGLGTWRTLAAAGDQVAAGIPLSSDSYIEGIRSITAPVWVFHGDMDTATPVTDSRLMVNGLKSVGQLPRYTERAGGKHSGWSNIYADSPNWTGSYTCGSPTDTSSGLYAWMFGQQSPALIEPDARPASPSDVLLFDFGELSITPSPDADGRHWNLIRDSQLIAGSQYTEAVTQTGQKTRVSLHTTSKFLRSNNAGVRSSHYYPESAQRDNFNVGSGAGHNTALMNSAMIELRNLPANSPCRITFFGSRSGNDGGRSYLTRFQIGDQWKDLEAGNNSNEAISLGAIQSNNEGTLVIEVGVSPEGTARHGILSTMEVEINPHLEVHNTTFTENTIEHQFPTRRHWFYQLQYSNNLTSWQNVPEIKLTGDGSMAELTNPLSSATTMFYRISESLTEPPP